MKSCILGVYAVLLLWLLVSSSVQAHDGRNPSACLRTTNTKVPLKNLVSYALQHKPVFDVNAVRFLTIRGKVVCLDPTSPWAIKAMKYLDSKNKPKPVSNKNAHHSVTAVPVNTSTTNRTQISAQI